MPRDADVCTFECGECQLSSVRSPILFLSDALRLGNRFGFPNGVTRAGLTCWLFVERDDGCPAVATVDARLAGGF
jgi:hypothetical protein